VSVDGYLTAGLKSRPLDKENRRLWGVDTAVKSKAP
jgi:hypothetical protein